jgi:hypothetical protein
MTSYPIDPKQLPDAAMSLPPEYHAPGQAFHFANSYLYQLWVDLDAALSGVAPLTNQTVVDTGAAGTAKTPPVANSIFPAPSGVTVASGTGGTLPNTPWYGVVTYTYGNGNESGPSNEVTITPAASGTVTVTVPSTPAGVTAINLYGRTQGGESILVGTTTISGAINTFAAAVKAASLKSQNH